MATLYAYSPNGTQATLSYSVIGFTQSLQQNGWCKLPNGLILQWGSANETRTKGYHTFNFPISATILIVVSMLKSNRNGVLELGWHGIGTWSSSQVNITWNTYEDSSPVNMVGFILISK